MMKGGWWSSRAVAEQRRLLYVAPWCAPSRASVSRLPKDTDIEVRSVDDFPLEAARHGITATPSLVTLEGDAVVGMQVGELRG